MRGRHSLYPYLPTAEGWRSPAGILSNSVASRLRQESRRHISGSYQHPATPPPPPHPHWNSSIKAQTRSCTSVQKQRVSTSQYQQPGPACQVYSEAQARRERGKGEVGERRVHAPPSCTRSPRRSSEPIQDGTNWKSPVDQCVCVSGGGGGWE